MREAVLMLYGEYQNDEGIKHPDDEDMFPDRPGLQEGFAANDVEFHIARVLEEPNGRRELGDAPRIEVAERPIYNERGTLLPETVFEEGSLYEYPTIIDHWVANFQDRVVQPDGSTLRTAYGLGVPNNRLWNCRPIQDLANDKLLMDRVLAESGVGIPTYPLDALDALVQEHPGSTIFYKPVDGSLSKGTAQFETPQEVLAAVKARTIAPNGILQPYLDLTSPLTTLRAPDGDSVSAQKLAQINTTPDRLREVRMHTLTYLDDQGKLQVEAYPTLKYSKRNTPVMKRAGCVALAAESVSAETYALTQELGRSVVLAAADLSGETVTQYYGTVDWVQDKAGRWYAIDINCRGPRLTVESPLARTAFTRVLARNALQNSAAA